MPLILYLCMKKFSRISYKNLLFFLSTDLSPMGEPDFANQPHYELEKWRPFCNRKGRHIQIKMNTCFFMMTRGKINIHVPVRIIIIKHTTVCIHGYQTPTATGVSF